MIIYAIRYHSLVSMGWLYLLCCADIQAMIHLCLKCYVSLAALFLDFKSRTVSSSCNASVTF